MLVNQNSVTATQLKLHVAEILNLALFQRATIYIERHGRRIAKIVPVEQIESLQTTREQTLRSFYGALPDFPAPASQRFFRKRQSLL